MYEGDSGKKIHMVEYITFSEERAKLGHLQTYTAL